MSGRVVSIVYRPHDGESDGSGYLRIPLESARLVEGHGIEGDARGGQKRQLNVMGTKSVLSLAADGFAAAPGQLGEQIVIDGLDVDSLPPAARIAIGPSACIEIVEPRTGCAKFERYQGRRREEAAQRMGMMARVVVGGDIAVGDEARIAGDEGGMR